VKIEVIVRQQDMAQPPVVLRFMTLEPENLRRREAGQKEQSDPANDSPGAAEFFREQCALGHRARVAPELGRADHLPLLVERHKTVLLARDADAADPGAVDPGGDLEDHRVERRGPVPGVLFHVADRQTVDEPVRRAGFRDHLFLREVQHDRLGALRA
jgi:hypothetical protein